MPGTFRITSSVPAGDGAGASRQPASIAMRVVAARIDDMKVRIAILLLNLHESIAARTSGRFTLRGVETQWDVLSDFPTHGLKPLPSLYFAVTIVGHVNVMLGGDY
jgi:hypothetical protein